MTAPQIQQKIIEILREEICGNAPVITLETDLRETLCANPVDMRILMLTLEFELDVPFAAQDANKFSTVGDLVNFALSHSAIEAPV